MGGGKGVRKGRESGEEKREDRGTEREKREVAGKVLPAPSEEQ